MIRHRRSFDELKKLIESKETLQEKDMDHIDYIYAVAARAVNGAAGENQAVGKAWQTTLKRAWTSATRTRDAEKRLIAGIGRFYQNTEKARVRARMAMRRDDAGTDWREITIDLLEALENDRMAKKNETEGMMENEGNAE